MLEKRYNWLNPYISKIIIVRDHEDDRILNLARVHGFFAVVAPKKVVIIINHPINNEIIRNNIF